MAEDDRAIAEGSASWSLQGGMDLHFCGRRLQPSAHAEPGDSSDVSRCRSVSNGSKNDLRTASGCTQSPSQSHKIAEPEENLCRLHPFFRSLLVVECLPWVSGYLLFALVGRDRSWPAVVPAIG